MPFELMNLPYALDALEPTMSRETVDVHYNKHHRGYVKKLNELIEGTEYEFADLETILRLSKDKIYNNAAQVWNHNFFWLCLTPEASEKPTGDIAKRITKEFGTFENFKKAFIKEGVDLFGSGWVWLIGTDDGGLKILAGKDADNPIAYGLQPLLTCDVWEHAYYLDHRNDRESYLKSFWKLVNWDFVNETLASGSTKMSGTTIRHLPVEDEDETFALQ